MLLDDIVASATDDQQSVSGLLRMSLVIAQRLRNNILRRWADRELSGYHPDEAVPSYRVLSTVPKGDFSGAGGLRLSGRPIPLALLEERHRVSLVRTPLISPIFDYERICSSGEEHLQLPWDPYLVEYYRNRIPMHGCRLTAAWQELSISHVAGMLDSIRNRVLTMTLGIKAGLEGDSDLTEITLQQTKKIEQVIAKAICGDVAATPTERPVTGSASQASKQRIVPGDWQHLSQVLRRIGISQLDLEELSEFVEEESRLPGPKVQAWVMNAAPTVVSGGVKIDANVSQILLWEYLKQYYGAH